MTDEEFGRQSIPQAVGTIALEFLGILALFVVGTYLAWGWWGFERTVAWALLYLIMRTSRTRMVPPPEKDLTA